MDAGEIYAGIRNFFVCFGLVPFIVCKFVTAWLYTNSTVKNSSKILGEKLLKMGLPEDVAETLTKEYASVKDYIFEGFLKRKEGIQAFNAKKSGGLRRILIKILPGGQIFLRIKTKDTKNFTSATFTELTKIVILLVGVARALERDIYWVTVCLTSYILYSLLFGFASELINKHQGLNGLSGSVVNTIRESISDTKVIAVVGLALSSHSILGAPFVPLYHVIPCVDYVEHFISGLGIGLFAVKAYRTFISYISYTKALTIFGSLKLRYQISLFEANAELPFVCYSSIFVGLIWESLEEIAEKFTPRVVNVFFWNGVADIIMGLLGAVTAYMIVHHFVIVKKKGNCLSTGKNSKVDSQAVQKASHGILTRMKEAMDSVYSESSVKNISKAIGVYRKLHS